jgi:carbonic anhydrase/acetyltransferase-like protein (isoleucine patch superfamily)
VCGDVEIGEECRIMFGAVLVAEERTRACRRPNLIMENAAVRA